LGYKIGGELREALSREGWQQFERDFIFAKTCAFGSADDHASSYKYVVIRGHLAAIIDDFVTPRLLAFINDRPRGQLITSLVRGIINS